MPVRSLALRDFRTYERAEAAFGSGLTVVYGPNGAGKSNLLEGLYYACTGASPRTRNERELIRFGAPALRATVTVGEEDNHELTVAYGASGEGGEAVKRMSSDGAPLERLVDSPFRPLLAVFMPDRLELVKGAPAGRRAQLDRFVAALHPAQAEISRAYSRALAQRNALIASIRAGRSSGAALDTWDHQLAARGVELIGVRREAVAALESSYAELAASLGLMGQATIVYRPRSDATTPQELADELAERRESDLRRGFTGHGPHRDELLLRRDGRELRVYGSQGEQRLALLALLLAERAVLAERRSQIPVMLLDDVMSELDAERRELLVAELAGGGQSVLATTDLAHVPQSSGPVAQLRVEPGRVLQEELAA